MNMNMFDQFLSPIFWGSPLITFALVLPWLFFPSPRSGWYYSRLLTLQGWSIKNFTRQLLHPMSPASHKWALLFVSLFVLLMSLNLLGLLPYIFTPTAQLALNFGFAVPLWLATVLLGLRKQPTRTLAHMLPEGTPIYLIPFTIVVETISFLFRPLALAVRLTANLTAGHLLLHLASSGTMYFFPTLPTTALAMSSLIILIWTVEVAVAVIQAYVFVLLLSLYLQENT